jgi:FkbM family methyltransferase
MRLNLDLSTYPDCCMAVGLYELDTVRLVRRLLQAGDHFVDCGANIGYFTLAAARRVGASGRVDSFEPDPLNRARLQANLAANDSPAQIHVHEVALSDRAGEATLYHPTGVGQNHGEASLFAAPGAEANNYTVRTARLDEEIQTPPRLIKMDIEGAELAAIKGMTRLLSSGQPPQLIVEHNPHSAETAGHKAGDLLRALRESQPRYRAHWIGWGLREIPTPEDIDRVAREGNILYRVE